MTIKLCSAAKGRLDRQLTSPVFTARQIYRMTLPLILDSLSIMFINMLITALSPPSPQSTWSPPCWASSCAYWGASPPAAPWR